MSFLHRSATLKRAATTRHDGLFVLNEESPDRLGDVIEVSGWDLRQFAANPVALYQHDVERPIGRWDNVRVEGKRLLGELHLASTALARMAKTLIEEGVLRAVSVGFVPKESEPLKAPPGALRIKAAELLEVSLVSVPAHPRALLLSKSLKLSAAERRLVFRPSMRRDAAAMSGSHPIAELAKRDLEAIRRVLGR